MAKETLASLPEVDGALHAHADALGPDFAAYRNHVTRVLLFAFEIGPALRSAPESLIVAGAFHDLGIWSAKTLDYLEPSCRLATEHLASTGRAALGPEVEAIIQNHHKVRRNSGPFALAVETFRRADLADLSLGALPAGLDPAFVLRFRELLPNRGFHKRLIDLSWRRILRFPLRPLPMFRW